MIMTDMPAARQATTASANNRDEEPMSTTSEGLPAITLTDDEHKFVLANPGCLDMVLLVNDKGDLCEYQETSEGKPQWGDVVFPEDSGVLSIYKRAALNQLVTERNIDPRSVIHLDRVVVTFALAA